MNEMKILYFVHTFLEKNLNTAKKRSTHTHTYTQMSFSWKGESTSKTHYTTWILSTALIKENTFKLKICLLQKKKKGNFIVSDKSNELNPP